MGYGEDARKISRQRYSVQKNGRIAEHFHRHLVDISILVLDLSAFITSSYLSSGMMAHMYKHHFSMKKIGQRVHIAF